MKLINHHWYLNFAALSGALHQAYEQLVVAMQTRNIQIEIWMHGQP